ncbi:NfeD family protein [Galactobacter sp.]|uniref:NfeD family protein n=1 Tax=Galactobacter sp. TaxID=2676125 RepID=UPI0025BF8C46|nr:NfeD family protein [Galactobacter sp.]
MVEWIAENSWAFWLIVVLVFIGIEMLTLDLWFATMGLGAAGGVITDLVGGDFWVQLLVFAVLTLILMIFLRPVALKHLQKPSATRTNVDALMGVQALVVETVTAQSGTAKIGGETWTARAPAGVTIPSGSHAWVAGVSGATAILSPSPIPAS